MEKYQIAIIGILCVAFLFFRWITKWGPFFDGLVWLKDEKIRADFELCRSSQTVQHWSSSAKLLLDEVRRLKRLAILCSFDTSNRVAMTEELLRKEVAVITEKELQRALRDARIVLVNAASWCAFDDHTLTGLSLEYFERVRVAYQEFVEAWSRLADVVPKEGVDADIERFKTSLRDLLMAER